VVLWYVNAAIRASTTVGQMTAAVYTLCSAASVLVRPMPNTAAEGTAGGLWGFHHKRLDERAPPIQERLI